MINALVPEPVDRKALEGEVAAALASANTKIFLDTSTLIWTYRLHEAARSEFLDWLQNGPHPGRAKIPRRALHELSRYRHNTAVLFPFKQKLGRLPSLLRQLDEWAHLITDDVRAISFGFKDRKEYFDLIRDLHGKIGRALKPVTSGADQQIVEAQLIPFFNALAMDGDIHSDLDILKDEYLARAELRIPPGYEDRTKRPDAQSADADDFDRDAGEALPGANRFGDFAIWSEILEWLNGLDQKPESVVLITHDQKRDWLYIPERIVNFDGRTKSNSDPADRVTVAHPLLTKELSDRTGVDRLYVLTVPQLAQTASRQNINATLIELARAVQAEALERVEESQSAHGDGTPAGDDVFEATGLTAEVEVGLTVIDEAAAEVLRAASAESQSEGQIKEALEALPRPAFQDRLYRRDPTGDSEAEVAISDLKTHNWYTQNPAANAALTVLRTGNPSNLQIFILGRNLYQAACGGAGTPINILSDLEQELQTVEATRANIFYAGALFEAYFDANGTLRSYPKGEKIDRLFDLQDAPRYQSAVDWLRDRIGNQSNKFLALPSHTPTIKDVQLKFHSDTTAATGIWLGSLELTEPASAPRSSLGAAVTNDGVLRKLSRHFDVPEWMIAVEPAFEDTRDFSAISLRAWGPSTDLTFD